MGLWDNGHGVVLPDRVRSVLTKSGGYGTIVREKAAKMNLVLIIIDTLRKDHVGCYGNTWIETPNLDRLAKESVIFDAAYSESLPTLPQRRAMHTGMRTFPFHKYNPRKGDIVKIYGWSQFRKSKPRWLRC